MSLYLQKASETVRDDAVEGGDALQEDLGRGVVSLLVRVDFATRRKRESPQVVEIDSKKFEMGTNNGDRLAQEKHVHSNCVQKAVV